MVGAFTRSRESFKRGKTMFLSKLFKRKRPVDNMTTADKKQIVDKIMSTQSMQFISKRTWLNKFYWDTKENDPKNKELLEYIEKAKQQLYRGKK